MAEKGLSQATGRQNPPAKDWVVGTDDVGHAVLEWKVDARSMQQEDDPLAKTYNFLERLDIPTLAIEGDAQKTGRNPYDSGVFPIKRDE